MLHILCLSVIMFISLQLKESFQQILTSDTLDMSRNVSFATSQHTRVYAFTVCRFEFLTPSSLGAVLHVQIYIPNRDRDMFGDQSNCQWLAQRWHQSTSQDPIHCHLAEQSTRFPSNCVCVSAFTHTHKRTYSLCADLEEIMSQKSPNTQVLPKFTNLSVRAHTFSFATTHPPIHTPTHTHITQIY